MAAVKPFRGLRYDPGIVGDISGVVAPPYDVINEGQRQAFCARHPRNIVHLTLGRRHLSDDPPPERYEQASRELCEWVRSRVLRRESTAALYLYEQEYDVPEGTFPRGGGSASSRLLRRGFIGALELADYGEGVVYPHEGTLPAPKADRLRLMRACQCSLSPIFTLYSDPARAADGVLDGIASAERAAFEVVDDAGVTHRLWVLDDAAAIDAVRNAMRDKVVVIADGHHRYETAVAYRDEMRAAAGDSSGPWDYALAFCCNIAAAQVTILPCHRLIRKLPPETIRGFVECARDVFELEEVGLGEDAAQRQEKLRRMIATMAARGEGAHIMGAYWGGAEALLLTVKSLERALGMAGPTCAGALREVDVALLHGLIIEGILGLRGGMAESGVNVFFTRDAVEAMQSVDSGESAMALFVNATRPEEVMDVALAGQQMPQKGTYFYPKLLSGTVLYDLRAEQ